MAKSREAFRTISEVAEWLDTPAHVLRFWESKFPQIKPVKRAGGRRYYRPEDMALLGGIKTLLHEDGLTIKGAQKLLREKGVRHVSSLGPSPMEGESDDTLIEGRLSEPEAATGEARGEQPAPEEAATGPEETTRDGPTEADREDLPAFLRRSPGMASGAPPAGPPEGDADEATADEDPGEDMPAVSEAGPAETGTPSPEGPAPHPAIPEMADLAAALDADPEADPTEAVEPRVIHETHDPGSDWQPQLPFGSLRPAPDTAEPAAARPGLLSLLAGAEKLAAEPARLGAALARLEALRDRPGA